MDRAFSYLTDLVCTETGESHLADQVQGLSRAGAMLWARYDLERMRVEVERDEISSRAPDLWRYHELLPVRESSSIRSLGEGMTPLTDAPTLGDRLGVPRLRIKDESLLPTGSFKARGAAVGVARAAELGIERFAMPTNGNAGAAWATYGTRYGLSATIVLPDGAPSITRSEAVFAGATVYLVDGLISDAGRIVSRFAARSGDFDASTLKEPYRVEGKKTMGLEIAEQLGWRVPDVIVYPTGGGVGLLGIYKAMRELQVLGWIGKKMPRLVAVQSDSCDPVVRAFAAGKDQITPLTDTQTIAFGVNVPAPLLGAPRMLRAIRETEGTAISVSDSDIMDAIALCGETEGLVLCPEGASTIVAVDKLRETDWIRDDEEVVILNTGAGNKYGDALAVDLATMHKNDDL